MFEKEAEEYYYENYHVTLNIGEEERKKKVTDIFIKGAEFGFQKGIKTKINTTTISDCPIKDEWHYCKDELPDHNEQFYVALKGQTETFILNYDYDEYDESKMVWLDDDGTNFDDEVYAWREKFKAPKESE